jgi:hypothetical protein
VQGAIASGAAIFAGDSTHAELRAVGVLGLQYPGIVRQLPVTRRPIGAWPLREINVQRLLTTFRHLVRSDDGMSLSEYAVMLALIVCLCMGPIQTLGCRANQSFTNTSNSLKR